MLYCTPSWVTRLNIPVRSILATVVGHETGTGTVLPLAAPAATSDGTHRPLTLGTLDNLGEATSTSRYDGDLISLRDLNADGVPDTLDAGKLVAYATSAYDEQGRAYQTKQYAVTPGTGAVSSTALTADSFYDHRGNVVESVSPTGEATKTAYDGAGRATFTYVTDGGVLDNASNAGTWAAAGSVAGDVVLSQTQSVYDGDGNVVETITSDRFNTDANTATGALGTPTTGVDARVSYMASYFDAADRDVADVNVGTDGGSAWTRPSTVPTSSDTVLVTSTTYNSMGMTDAVTDPRGVVAKTFYDNLGRTTSSIAAYTDGTPTSSTNQTTRYTYDGDGHTLTMTAALPGGTFQTTAYVYGVTTAGGSAVNSNDLLAKTEYPDATTGSASTAAADDVSYAYDALGEPLTMTDQNGTTHAYAYDSLGRQTADIVTTLGSGVDGSVRRLGYTLQQPGPAVPADQLRRHRRHGGREPGAGGYNGLGQLVTQYQSHAGSGEHHRHAPGAVRLRRSVHRFAC